MKLIRLLALSALAATAVGCDDDDDSSGPVPQAAVRFVNAVPDTGAMDFRLTDIVADAFLNVAFRGTTQYQVIDAGSHNVRIFMSGTNPAVASTVMGDVTFDFAAGSTYTVVILGFARTGQSPAKQVVITTDDPPTVPATEVRIRGINAGAGLGAVNLFFRAASGDPLPGSPQISNVAFLGESDYVGRAPGALNVAVTSTANMTVIANGTAPAGEAGTSSTNPIAGSSVGGSALTAIVVPRSVAGSQAPAGFTTPAVIYLTDRRPNLTVQ